MKDQDFYGKSRSRPFALINILRYNKHSQAINIKSSFSSNKKRGIAIYALGVAKCPTLFIQKLHLVKSERPWLQKKNVRQTAEQLREFSLQKDYLAFLALEMQIYIYIHFFLQEKYTKIARVSI